jgi:hypothetical protein
VAIVVARGLDLQPRLSSAAEAELLLVRHIIDDTRLRDTPDFRFIDSPSAPRFCSREAYRMLSPSRPRDASPCIAWALRLPTKLKIFIYLLDIDRLSTRANLFYKSCAPSDVCAACPAIETGRHLFFDCHLASDLWARLDVPIPADPFSVWDLRSPLPLPDKAWQFGAATILWAIWKSRNGLVFNGRATTSSFTLRKASDDLLLWRWRLPISERAHLDSLRSYILSRA